MSSTFDLGLDTHAPAVTYGDATGVTAGELLRIEYVSDEPIERARLRLADGRYLTMGVAADELTVLLPPDTPQGWAGVEVRDDVWNLRLDAAVVLLTGTVVIPEEPTYPPGIIPTPAGGRPRTSRGRLIVARRGAVGIRSGPSTSSQIRRNLGIGVSSLATRRTAELRVGEFVGVASRCDTRVEHATESALGIATSAVKTRRDDEEWLLLLLLMLGDGG